MQVLKPRRPSPAFVLAAIALFVSLSGIGYATTKVGQTSHRSHAAATHKPLTKKQIQKLIASYVKKNRKKLRGPAGAAGAPGAAGAQGPQGPAGNQGLQGPGAIRISDSEISGTGSHTVATIDPWSVTLTCAASSPNATLTVHGPGTVATATTFQGSTPGVQGPVNISGSGSSLLVDQTNPGSQIAFLQSGSTIYELKVIVNATNGGLFENCNVIGDAIPVA